MSATEEQQVIMTYVQNNWNPAADGPLTLPNHKEPSANAGTFYTSVVIIANEAARTRNSIGAPRLIRNRGFIFFTIYTPKDDGTLRATKLRDKLMNMFDERVFLLPSGQRVVCGISEPQILGLKDNLYRTVVNVPFHRDEWPQ